MGLISSAVTGAMQGWFSPTDTNHSRYSRRALDVHRAPGLILHGTTASS